MPYLRDSAALTQRSSPTVNGTLSRINATRPASKICLRDVGPIIAQSNSQNITSPTASRRAIGVYHFRVHNPFFVAVCLTQTVFKHLAVSASLFKLAIVLGVLTN